jgi:hypothetical protein
MFLGRICAYADIDKDRLTDLIVQKGSTLLVMPQSETGMFKADDSKKFKNITLDSDKPVFCSVGDFDGDASVDIMVVTVYILNEIYIHEALMHIIYIKPHKESRNFFGGGGVDRYKVDIYYLEAKEFQRYPLNYTFFDHPSVLDLNGDGVSDIIGFTVDTETETVTYPLYCRQGTRTIGGLVKCDEKFKNFKYPAHPLPNFSPIFADIDDDMVPEIIFGFIEDERLVISIWHVIDDE